MGFGPIRFLMDIRILIHRSVQLMECHKGLKAVEGIPSPKTRLKPQILGFGSVFLLFFFSNEPAVSELGGVEKRGPSSKEYLKT